MMLAAKIELVLLNKYGPILGQFASRINRKNGAHRDTGTAANAIPRIDKELV
jgi:hypothetical protein